MEQQSSATQCNASRPSTRRGNDGFDESLMQHDSWTILIEINMTTGQKRLKQLRENEHEETMQPI